MKITKFIIIIFIFFSFFTIGSANDFLEWKKKFKEYALTQGISLKILNDLIDKSIFLPEIGRASCRERV